MIQVTIFEKFKIILSCCNNSEFEPWFAAYYSEENPVKLFLAIVLRIIYRFSQSTKIIDHKNQLLKKFINLNHYLFRNCNISS